MGHLDIRRQTHDILSIRPYVPVAAHVFGIVMGVLGLGLISVWLYAAVSDENLIMIGFGAMLGLLTLALFTRPWRVTLDRSRDRLTMTRPGAFRIARTSIYRLSTGARPSAGGYVGVLQLGVLELARGPVRATREAARAELLEDEALVQLYLEG